MYPTTNEELLNSKYAGKDEFFLLAYVSQGKDGIWSVEISPDLPPMAKNDDLKQKVFEETGVTIPSRKEINDESHGLGANIKMLGAGAFLWLKGADNQKRMALLKKDAGAPAAPNSWMQPSGLASDNPLFAMFREFNEETGVISVNEQKRELTVHGFSLPDEFAVYSEMQMQQIIYDKSLARDNVIKRVEAEHPQFKNLTLIFSKEAIPTKLESDFTQHEEVIYRMPDGQVFIANGHVVDEKDHNSFNLHIAIEADMSEFSNVINVDPEFFGRQVAILTAQEVLELDKTTGPLGAYRDSWNPAVM